MNPLDMEWGTATPEFVSGDESLAVHVFNHALDDENQLAQNLAFIKARSDFFRRNLPSHTKQHVIFDDRGQEIADPLRDALREAVSAYAMFEFMTDKE